jgi:hypothetical protein|tara:strand:+ start:4015 stop:4377 length:363 start_codon:yes stop_codon:yes gene_type:complete
MSDKGKYPFADTPNVNKDFSEGISEKLEKEEPEQQPESEIENYDRPAPVPKPSWEKENYDLYKIEEQLPYIIQSPRNTEFSHEQQNYDVIKDNNIDVGIELKPEWEAKVCEAPTPDLGDD